VSEPSGSIRRRVWVAIWFALIADQPSSTANVEPTDARVGSTQAAPSPIITL
jgi:hypothetical protein